jgi:hypothetical protein
MGNLATTEIRQARSEVPNSGSIRHRRRIQ